LVQAGGGARSHLGLQLGERQLAQVRDGAQPQPLEDGQGPTANPAQDADRLPAQKIQDLFRRHHDQSQSDCCARSGRHHALTQDEQARLTPIAERLVAHLDRLSLDELFQRIAQLAQTQQRQLLERLTELLESVVV
jgi:hypothetical protein